MLLFSSNTGHSQCVFVWCLLQVMCGIFRPTCPTALLVWSLMAACLYPATRAQTLMSGRPSVHQAGWLPCPLTLSHRWRGSLGRLVGAAGLGWYALRHGSEPALGAQVKQLATIGRKVGCVVCCVLSSGDYPNPFFGLAE